MPNALTWPKRRTLSGHRDLGPLHAPAPQHWIIDVEPGRLTCWMADGVVLTFDNPDELRAYAMAVYAAAIEFDLSTQEDAAKASWERRRRRGLEGNRHRPVIDRPEPPMHMEATA